MENDESGNSFHEAESAPPEKSGRIGEMLRREREKRQISIETIAAKLRLNAKYIEALEEDRYDRLPGDTYIRVYLRSLAQYLSLDSEDIFRRFFDERGLSGADTLRKDSTTKINLPALESRKKNSPVVAVVILLIIVLAGLGFLARKHRWLSTHVSKAAVSAVDSATGAAASVAGTVADSGKSAGVAVESSASVAESTHAAAAPASDTLQPPVPGTGGAMKLLVMIRHDSSRVRVYSDGKEWRKTLHRGAWITFFAQDSFNVFVSASEAVTLTLDGKPVSLPERTGVSAIKVGRAGVAWWTAEKWERIFH
jgi:cytoskeleton protein RodZ